ncbi:MAG: hypothetical protein BHW58_07180 [Azospirillum sp. 51_20]|jgi:membrane protein|nr:MAG: hypothetical protein BHW58_07180 [Azospirillum sp. 51_20]
MKPVLPEKNTTKLPKRYWFTLIFMLFITILSGIYVYTPTPPRAEDNIILLISATLFTAFVFLYWLLIRSFNNYRQKLNIIKIHIITFYMTLMFFLLHIYKLAELAKDFAPIAAPKKYYIAYLIIGTFCMNYFILISTFIIFSTFYLIFGKKAKNIQISMPPLTQFIIYWGIALIINFPPLVAYLVVISSVAS